MRAHVRRLRNDVIDDLVDRYDTTAEVVESLNPVQRFPHTTVHYQVADLRALPAAWRHAFGLVVEIITVQALPDPPRRQAIENIAGLVAAEGTPARPRRRS